MRAVHDILYDKTLGHAPGPCAFIQHGNEETGYSYECVCPFCAQTVGDHIPPDENFTYGKLLTTLKKMMAGHISLCTAGGFKVKVYITKTPLGTSEEPRIV